MYYYGKVAWFLSKIRTTCYLMQTINSTRKRECMLPNFAVKQVTYNTLCLLVQQLFKQHFKGYVAHLIHLICSPESIYSTRCCPWDATSAWSYCTKLQLTFVPQHLHKCKVITSIIYTIIGNAHKVLAKHGSSVVLAQIRCVAFGEERYRMKKSDFR